MLTTATVTYYYLASLLSWVFSLCVCCASASLLCLWDLFLACHLSLDIEVANTESNCVLLTSTHVVGKHRLTFLVLFVLGIVLITILFVITCFATANASTWAPPLASTSASHVACRFEIAWLSEARYNLLCLLSFWRCLYYLWQFLVKFLIICLKKWWKVKILGLLFGLNWPNSHSMTYYCWFLGLLNCLLGILSRLRCRIFIPHTLVDWSYYVLWHSFLHIQVLFYFCYSLSFLIVN